jgi:hypothetical protein
MRNGEMRMKRVARKDVLGYGLLDHCQRKSGPETYTNKLPLGQYLGIPSAHCTKVHNTSLSMP